jgi:ubiquinone/menaquinone biosynthesis C-methylase UbiE
MGDPAADYARELGLALQVTAPAVRAAIADFAGAGPRGLDVGCGQGQHSLWLAEAAGPESLVTGLDGSQAHLAAAAALAATSPQAAHVEFVRGELESLPFSDAAFDWLWCADTLWPGRTTDDPVRCVQGFARVLRCGGKLGLLYWSSQQLLPGYPLLEARLGTALAARVPYLAAKAPEQHFMRAAGWLAAAGFVDLRARTYVAELSGPLSAPQREGLAYCLQMLWGGFETEVPSDDWRAFERLSRLQSKDCLLRRPDYYGFVTYTLFTGVKDAGEARPPTSPH